MPDERPELRNWLADALSRRVRHPALEETLFGRLRDLEHGPLEQLGELVRLAIEELRVAQRRVAEQAGDLRALQQTAATLTERLDDLAEQVTPSPVVAEGHVLMLAVAAGYRTIACAGPPPAPGERIELDGLTLHVLSRGRSPYPADTRPCVFALRA